MAMSAEFKQTVETWKKRLYWGIGLLIVILACYYLYNTMQRPIASVLLFIGGILTLYYYWVKWFELLDPMRWQPSVSPCPDYLTLIDPGNGTSTPAKCADFIGVSANGQMTKASMESLPNVPSSSVFEVPVAGSVSASTICDEVAKKGLVWTGVCPEPPK